MGILGGFYQWCAARLDSGALADAVDDETIIDAAEDVCDGEQLANRGARSMTDRSASERRQVLEGVAESLELDTDDVFYRPVETIEELEDDPDTVYLHLLEPGADVGAYVDRFDELFRKHYGHDTRGLHIPLTELRELREADPAYIQQQAAPWLVDRLEKADS